MPDIANLMQKCQILFYSLMENIRYIFKSKVNFSVKLFFTDFS